MYTAHATTFDNVDLQLEVSNGFQAYKGDVKIFDSYDEAMEAAKDEQKQYDSIKSVSVREVELD